MLALQAFFSLGSLKFVLFHDRADGAVGGANPSTCGFLRLPNRARFGQVLFGDSTRFGAPFGPPNPKRNRMASNTLPRKRDRLFALGDDMCSGAHDHEVAVGPKQNKEEVKPANLRKGGGLPARSPRASLFDHDL